MDEAKDVDGSRLLKLVEATAISPADALALVERQRERARKSGAADVDAAVADGIISRYAKLAAMSGGLAGLAGIVPGVGTIVSMTGGALADAGVCMKLQVDMCMCLAASSGYDVTSEDARHLAFLIAAGGTLERTGSPLAARVASQAGVRLLRQYLRGATLQALKNLFRQLGIILTRKALEKALPFGIGVTVGAGANYALTAYVGRQAKEWFALDRAGPADEPAVDA